MGCQRPVVRTNRRAILKSSRSYNLSRRIAKLGRKSEIRCPHSQRQHLAGKDKLTSSVPYSACSTWGAWEARYIGTNSDANIMIIEPYSKIQFHIECSTWSSHRQLPAPSLLIPCSREANVQTLPGSSAPCGDAGIASLSCCHINVQLYYRNKVRMDADMFRTGSLFPFSWMGLWLAMASVCPVQIIFIIFLILW